MGLGSQSPNNREGLSAVSAITGNNEYVYSTNHALHVNATVTPVALQDVNLTEIGGVAVALGQTTMSASLPVTLASNQSALAVSQSGNWSTRTQDGSGNAITSTASALDVNIKSGNITGFATAANQTNGSQLTQIVDAGGEAVTVTGGKLDVNATISGSGGGTSEIDNSAYTAGASSETPIAGFYHSTIDTVTDGRSAAIGMTSKRGLFVNLQSAAGAEIGTSGSPLIVSGSGTAGSAATGVQTIQGIASMTPVQVSQATASNLNATVIGAGTAGTANSGVVTIQGIAGMTKVLVTPDANSAINLAQVGGSNVVTSASGVQRVGIAGNANATLDATVGAGTAPTNMLVTGGVYSSTEITLTNGQSAAMQLDSKGRQRNVIMDAATNTRGVNVTAGNALQSDLTSIAGTATATSNGGVSAGTQRVTLANDSTGVIASISTSITPGVAAANLGKQEDAGHNSGDTGVMALGVRQDVQSALTNTTLDYAAQTSDSVGSQYTTLSASTGAIGASMYWNSGLTSTKVAVNASGGNLYGYHLYNPNTTVAYVQFFNVASASVTVGTTAPNMVIAIPPLGWADAPPSGPAIGFATALTVAATTTSTGSGNPTTAILTNLWYK